jgi:hypothetical protein
MYAILTCEQCHNIEKWPTYKTSNTGRSKELWSAHSLYYCIIIISISNYATSYIYSRFKSLLSLTFYTMFDHSSYLKY